jgi:hypothetical protein
MLNRYLRLVSVLAATTWGCSAGLDTPGDAGLGPASDGGLEGSAPQRDGGPDGPIPRGDGGPCSPPATLDGFTPRPFVPAVLHQGVCSTAQISAYVAACGVHAAGASCFNWINANLDPDAGATCGNCIYPSLPDGGGSNAGASYEDPANQYAWPNYATCIQHEDPQHGTACGAAMNALYDCEAFACVASCAGDTDPAGLSSCESLADETVCATYFAAQATACAYDPIYATGGVGNCYAGGSDNQDPAQTFITTLICGSADALPDAGPTDAGGFDAGEACPGPGAAYPFPACFTKSCGAEIAACEKDCACQSTLADCFANLFDAQGCVAKLSQGTPGLAASVGTCLNPLLVNYPANCQ